MLQDKNSPIKVKSEPVQVEFIKTENFSSDADDSQQSFADASDTEDSHDEGSIKDEPMNDSSVNNVTFKSEEESEDDIPLVW